MASPCTFAQSYFGVLRGDETIQYKSPYPGVITLYTKNVGVIEKSKKVFDIKNHENNTKIEILKIKIDRLKKKTEYFKELYNSTENAYNSGFISLRELRDKRDEINENDIRIKELIAELKSLEHLSGLGNVSVNGNFIIRELSVSNQQNVNTGDAIMKIETLNKYYVDIKFDPVKFKGNIQNKKVKYRSLVNDKTGKGEIVKITSANSDLNSGVYGLKIASVVLNDTDGDMSALLDTAFEVIIDD